MSSPYKLGSEVPQILKYCPVNTTRLSRAIGKRGLQLHAVEQVGRIGRGKVGKARVQPLKLANITAAQRQPVIVALILILRVEADVGELVRLRKVAVVPVTKLGSSHGCTSRYIPNVPTISECLPQCGSRATRQ